jgi:hypothetical protein
MSKLDKKALEQYKVGIPITLEDMSLNEKDAEWTLVRGHDKLTKWSNEIGFIEWKEDGHFKEMFKGSEGLEIGRSLILAPFNMQFTWQTTEIIDFHVREEGGWYFKTKNSEYTLTRNK